ncbi:MAG TPA: helix-turn-helix transcriptional regulator [Luteibacter sp.]|jgi:AraC-like DNA-binding protein|uniref:AraC family transcriptional regulator n=1 Tax=Luteibacter sp. TaxID=1886636 RepID=UPI002F41B2DD
MPRIEQHDVFDPLAVGTTVVGIQAALARHDSGAHTHRMGQLLFALQGCMRISVRSPPHLSMLPPTHAAWIPAGVVHRVQLRDVVEYRSVYFDASTHSILPQDCRVIRINPMMRELLERITLLPFDTHWENTPFSALVEVAVHELLQSPQEPLTLPLPRDRRLAKALSGTALPPSLFELARHAGASERTLTRRVKAETGMGYQQWRQQWRILRAIELLSMDRPLAVIAQQLGFGSESAFIAFFRHQMGSSPAAWRRTVRKP